MSASETVSQHPAYEPFGAFRLLLAVFVITGHLFLLGPESDAVKALGLDDTGVALFFIISGYIIFSAYDHFYRGRTFKFAINRLLRIYPLFWVVFVFTFFPAVWLDVNSVQNYTFGEFFGDFMLFGRYFQTSSLPTMQQGWSLIVELQFYFAAFLFFAIGERVNFSTWLYRSLFVGVIIAYVLIWSTGSNTRFFSGLTWGPMFLLGVSVYRFKKHDDFSKELFFWIGLFTLFSIHQYFMVHLSHILPKNYFDPAIQIFVVITGVFFWLVSPYRKSLPKALDSYLGDLAYPVFLIHFPIIYILSYSKPLSSLSMMILATLMTFVLSIISVHWVEPFINRLRDRLRGQKL
jgi:peptidoglycan/LPS O-acetylase OafA/YrhL